MGNAWLALLLESPENVNVPDSPEWAARVAEHVEFGKAVGDRVLSGAPLHPPSAATTVRVRNGKTTLTDGPYVEGANGDGYVASRRVNEYCCLPGESEP